MYHFSKHIPTNDYTQHTSLNSPNVRNGSTKDKISINRLKHAIHLLRTNVLCIQQKKYSPFRPRNDGQRANATSPFAVLSLCGGDDNGYRCRGICVALLRSKSAPIMHQMQQHRRRRRRRSRAKRSSLSR